MTGAIASALFTAAWKGTLLVAFALVVHRLARNRVPSRWLCALLLVAIVRLLVPVAPAAPFSVFNLVPGETVAPAPVVVDAGRASVRPLDGLKPVVRPAAPDRSPWISIALALWGAGVFVVIARTVLQTRRFQRQLSTSTDVDRDDVLALVDECREVLNVRRRVPVVATSAVATPSLHGWICPTLLLPEGFLATFTREQLRYVVLHELAHLRRSDVLVNWIATAAYALHWFNPLVRLAVARLAEERELACDALALAALRAEERPAYGGTVLELVDRMRAAPAVPALVGMTATPEQLKRRIVMIASYRQSRFSIVFAAAVAAVGLVTLTDARAEERRTVRMKEQVSAPIREVMQKLETPVNAELTSASLDDVLHTIMNATGASIVIADGAVDDATRAKRLNVKAKNVPAHLVLFESLGTLHLAVKLTDTGVLVLKAPDGEEVHLRTKNGEHTKVMVRRAEAPAGTAPADIRKHVEITEDGERGGGRRKLTLKTDGAVEEGTLEVELVKEE